MMDKTNQENINIKRRWSKPTLTNYGSVQTMTEGRIKTPVGSSGCPSYAHTDGNYCYHEPDQMNQ